MYWTAWTVPDSLRPRQSYADSMAEPGKPMVSRSVGMQVMTRAPHSPQADRLQPVKAARRDGSSTGKDRDEVSR